MRLSVPCPAKINLFLAVGPKDEAGYHPLRTIFQAVSLFDELTVADTPLEPETAVREIVAGGLTLTTNWADLPESNTVTKAWRLLNEYVVPPPLWLHLEKRIPDQSGLGGGSSDAAGLLRAINRFLDARLEPRMLHDIAAAVGADVPFFLVGGRARAEGYGEKLTALDDAPTEHYLILKPDVSCSTKEAYAALDERPYPFRDFPENGELYNDFERVMPCESDDWMEHLQMLGAQGVLLSGSGSAVFGRFESEAAVDRALEDLNQRRGFRTWKARSLTRSESLEVGAR